jgi:hypothetical protein
MDGLASYIQSGTPQQVVGDPSLAEAGGQPVAEAITPIPEAVTPVQSGEPSSGAAGNTDASVSPPQSDQGLTTPDPRDEAIRQLQDQLDAQAQATAQLRQQQAAESARREEAQILAQIQAIPDEYERQQQYARYQLNKQQAIIQTQQAQIHSVQRQQEESQQEIARNSVVTIRAMQEGIPSEYIPLLKRSASPQELEHHITLLKQSLGQGAVVQQQQTRQGIVDSGVYAAGGAQAGFIPPEMPQERSGDLAGLIAATPPRFS